MASPQRNPDAQDETLRTRLDAAHGGLLRVHKSILDHERRRYERVNGPVEGALAFLQLVLNDPWFSWLRPISELVVQIDEFAASKEPRPPAEGEALLQQARDLLTPSEAGSPFGREYFRAMQESPDVAMAHAEWRKSMQR